MSWLRPSAGASGQPVLRRLRGDVMADKPLNERQRAFVRAYMGEAKGNGTQAARMAGYEGDDRTLAVTANRLLTHAKVSEELESIRQATTKATIMDAQEAAETLTTIARGEATDRRVVSGREGPVEADLPVQCHVRVEAVKALAKMRGYEAPQKLDVSVEAELVMSPEVEAALELWLLVKDDPRVIAVVKEVTGDV